MYIYSSVDDTGFFSVDQFSPIECSEDFPKSNEVLSISDAGVSIASASFYKTGEV